MSADFFDDVEGTEQLHPNDKPIWTLDLNDPGNEDKILKWLKAEKEYLAQENQPRFQNIQRTLAIYKGIQYQSQDTRNRDASDVKQAIEKIIANNVYDLVESSISRLVKYKPGIAILPTNDEFEDKIGAEMTELWLSNIWYNQKYEDEIDPMMKRLAKIMGEAYLFIEWDPELGDEHPEYKEKYSEKVKQGERVQLMNDQGNAELDDDGNPIYIDAPVYNGDVGYRVVKTTDALVDRSTGEWKTAKYIFERQVMTVEEARICWPKAADKIKANNEAKIYDYEKLEVRKTRKNEVVIWRFHHRRSKGMDKGRYIVFTMDGILHNSELPYNHKQLPCVRYTDFLPPGELHAISKIDLVKSMTGAYNNLTNMILRNQVLVAHPKWMMPAGAAKLDQLGNDITIVQYKGSQPPVLVSASPTAPEVFNFRKELKEEFRGIYGQGQVQQGNPPPGIKAGIALQFLAEQESERANEDVLKSNSFQTDVAQMTIAVAGDYYEKDEQRQVRILGKGGAWKTIFFNVANLSKSYDVRVKNSSALPQSKAARTQTLMDLKEGFPELISNEQFLDLLDFAQDQKFMDLTTVSVRASEAENEQMLDPNNQKPVIPPEPYEDHIAHWPSHARAAREWSFKNMTPPEQQAKLKAHILATETLMVDQAKKNPLYLQQLAILKGFPMFYDIHGDAEFQMMVNPNAAPPLDDGPSAPGAELSGPYADPQLPVEGVEEQLPVNPPLPAQDVIEGDVAPPTEPGAI